MYIASYFFPPHSLDYFEANPRYIVSCINITRVSLKGMCLKKSLIISLNCIKVIYFLIFDQCPKFPWLSYKHVCMQMSLCVLVHACAWACMCVCIYTWFVGNRVQTIHILHWYFDLSRKCLFKSTDALSFLKKFSVIIKKKNVIKLIRSCLAAYGFSVMVNEDFPILRLDTFTRFFLHVFIFNI